jgi:hypothetical protein
MTRKSAVDDRKFLPDQQDKKLVRLSAPVFPQAGKL